MSKIIFPSFWAFVSLCALASCGGTKTSATPHTTMQEYDQATGSWKLTSKIVAAPPPQGGAIIVEQKKPGMMKKMGETLKKPLKWVGLGKDEPPPASALGSEQPAKPAAKP